MHLLSNYSFSRYITFSRPDYISVTKDIKDAASDDLWFDCDFLEVNSCEYWPSRIWKYIDEYFLQTSITVVYMSLRLCKKAQITS